MTAFRSWLCWKMVSSKPHSGLIRRTRGFLSSPAVVDYKIEQPITVIQNQQRAVLTCSKVAYSIDESGDPATFIHRVSQHLDDLLCGCIKQRQLSNVGVYDLPSFLIQCRNCYTARSTLFPTPGIPSKLYTIQAGSFVSWDAIFPTWVSLPLK